MLIQRNSILLPQQTKNSSLLVVGNKLRLFSQKIHRSLLSTFTDLAKPWKIAFSEIVFLQTSHYRPITKIILAIALILLSALVSVFKLICLPFVGIISLVSRFSSCCKSIPHFYLPHYPSEQSSDDSLKQYTRQLLKQLRQPICPDMHSLPLQKSRNIYQEVLQEETLQGWSVISSEIHSLICDLPLPCSDEERNDLDYTWANMLRVLSLSYHVKDRSSAFVAQATIQLLIKVLKSSSISLGKKLDILRYVASYHEKCPPTWVRSLTQELQNIYNQQDSTTDLILGWVQQFKHNLLASICSDQPEWHFMTAFISQHGEQIGLENEGIIKDTLTEELLSRPRMWLLFRTYLNQFLDTYKNSGEDLIQFITDQMTNGTDEEIATLNQLVVKDLEAAQVPSNAIADIMSDIFFPEEQDYQPSQELATYLLLKLGVLKFDKSS